MASKEKKHRSSSKSKSNKSEKHSTKHKPSGEKIAPAMKTIMGLVVSKPKHYTSRRMAAKLSEKFGSEIVRSAIASLEGSDKIGFDRKDGGRGKKGQHVMYPLVRKAA